MTAERPCRASPKPGRAGLTAVVEMLHGADNERLRRPGPDRAQHPWAAQGSSQGLGVALLRRLITAGLVDSTTSEFPVPFFTPVGVATMKGEEPARVRVPPPGAACPRAKKGERSLGTGASRGRRSSLFERLRGDPARHCTAKGGPGVCRLSRSNTARNRRAKAGIERSPRRCVWNGPGAYRELWRAIVGRRELPRAVAADAPRDRIDGFANQGTSRAGHASCG